MIMCLAFAVPDMRLRASSPGVLQGDSEDSFETYRQTVEQLAQKISPANPYLAQRFRREFLTMEAGESTPSSYLVYRNAVRKVPGARMMIEHGASDRYGLFWGQAYGITTVPELFAKQKASDDAVLRTASVADDRMTPLLLLRSNNGKLTAWRRTLIFEECVQTFLNKVSKQQPEALSYLSDFLTKPDRVFDDRYPKGFRIYSGFIDDDGTKNPFAQWTAYKLVARVAEDELEDAQKAGRLQSK